jgi:hypothetical protein
VMGLPNNWMPLSFGTSPANHSNAEGSSLWRDYHSLRKRFLNFIILELKTPLL